jgi:hypothetical protein
MHRVAGGLSQPLLPEVDDIATDFPLQWVDVGSLPCELIEPPIRGPEGASQRLGNGAPWRRTTGRAATRGLSTDSTRRPRRSSEFARPGESPTPFEHAALPPPLPLRERIGRRPQGTG